MLQVPKPQVQVQVQVLKSNYQVQPHCRFKQVNGIIAATEITEDLMQITEIDGIHRYYEECPLMLNRENGQLRLTGLYNTK